MAADPMDVLIGADERETGDPQAAERHLAAAKEADAAGDHGAALAELRKAVSADPSHPQALFGLAYALDRHGEDDEAISLYERCARLSEAPLNALINLAVLYEDHAQYAAAEKTLRQVLDTSPNHPRARLFMKDVQASRTMFYDEHQDRDLAKRNALLDTPVTDFELSVRARNCLKKMNIRTLGDLLRVSESELLAYKNFGETSLEEIKHMLTSKGLRLGQRVEEQQRAIKREVYDAAKRNNAEAALNKPVVELNLSVRARKALQNLNIRTLGELASRTEAELMGVKNFGQTSLVEVREKLAENGLSLRNLEF